MSIVQLTTYPSHLIRKAFRRIDPRSALLQDAYRFILKEEVSTSLF